MSILLSVVTGFLGGALGMAFFFWIASPKSPILKWNARRDPAYKAWIEMNREDLVLYYVVKESMIRLGVNARCRSSKFYTKSALPALLAELEAQREDNPEDITYGVGAIFQADPRLFEKAKTEKK